MMNETDNKGPDGDDAAAQSPGSLDRKANLAKRQAAHRDRLKEKLRSNLQRRKVQSRARREGEEDDRPGDLLNPAGSAESGADTDTESEA
jgi:hypothetical protein